MLLKELSDSSTLVRRLDVTVRVTDEVLEFTSANDGVLLETLIGRYVLNRHAREVWSLIDGKRTVGDICDALGDRHGSMHEVSRRTVLCCSELVRLGVVELDS